MFIKELEEYGYNVYWQVLNAKDYGIPQNRERVYCVIVRKDLDNGLFKFPEPTPLHVMLEDLLEENVDEKYYLSDEKAAEMVCTLPNQPIKSKKCIKVSEYGEVYEGNSETALSLLARDFKGFGKQQMTGVLECETCNTSICSD